MMDAWTIYGVALADDVTAIARRLGYSKTYVSQVLAGKLKPGAPLAAKLKRLGVEVA